MDNAVVVAEPERRKMGRPRHKWTEDLAKRVELCSRVGIPHLDIALLLGIGIKTLLRDYRQELVLGRVKANVKIGGKIYRKAMRGDNYCLGLWATTQMGWVRAARVEHTGANGGPILSDSRVDQTLSLDQAARDYLSIVSEQ